MFDVVCAQQRGKPLPPDRGTTVLFSDAYNELKTTIYASQKVERPSEKRTLSSACLFPVPTSFDF